MCTSITFQMLTLYNDYITSDFCKFGLLPYVTIFSSDL